MSQSILTKQRMTGAEFRLLPESKQPTKLINGELVASPSPRSPHQEKHSRLSFVVQSVMPGGKLLPTPMDLYLDDENVVLPDFFWVAPDSRCKLGEDGYWYGPPDLIIEILSPGTAKQDKITEFALYERHGVQEYWPVDPIAEYIEVWQLVEGNIDCCGSLRQSTGLYRRFWMERQSMEERFLRVKRT